MIILRLVVLVVLLYIGWILLKSIFGLKKKTAKKSRSGSGKIQDVLVEDPVCHTLVPKNQAVRLRQDGITYYFCSEKCCDKFNETIRGSK